MEPRCSYSSVENIIHKHGMKIIVYTATKTPIIIFNIFVLELSNIKFMLLLSYK